MTTLSSSNVVCSVSFQRSSASPFAALSICTVPSPCNFQFSVLNYIEHFGSPAASAPSQVQPTKRASLLLYCASIFMRSTSFSYLARSSRRSLASRASFASLPQMLDFLLFEGSVECGLSFFAASVQIFNLHLTFVGVALIPSALPLLLRKCLDMHSIMSSSSFFDVLTASSTIPRVLLFFRQSSRASQPLHVRHYLFKCSL